MAHYRLAATGLLVLFISGCGRQTQPTRRPAGEKPGVNAVASPPVALKSDKPGKPFEIPLALSTANPIDYPVSSGIPLPRGTVTELTRLQLFDSTGKPIAAQFDGLAQWPDGSYKSVLISTVVPASAAPAVYTLKGTPDATAPAVSSPLTVDEQRDAIDVVTGPMRFRVGKTHFRLIDQAWVDTNQNNSFEEDERLLYRPADIFLIDGSDGSEYQASRYGKSEVSVEESGPVRVVILARGKLQSARGATLTDFIVRLTAYAGQETVLVSYTLVDTREERDVKAARKSLALNVRGYGLRFPTTHASPAFGLFGGDRRQNAVAFGGPLASTQYLYQTGRMNYVNGSLMPFEFYYEGVAEGERADGWVDVSDPQKGIAVMVRKFWQQFPKELAVDQDDLIVYLHPPRAATPEGNQWPSQGDEPGRYKRPKSFYFLREGGAKTDQLLLMFHRGAGDARKWRDWYETFDVWPRLVAPQAWSCRSGVFGELLEAGPWSDQHDRTLMNNIFSRSVEAGQRYGSLAVLFGWRDYGDRLRPGWAADRNGVKIPGFYNDTHVGAHQFFVQYLRTHDERWYELGETATRHWVDIDVSHANRLGYWRRGYGPGEGHMIKHEMEDHDDRNIHKGHAHLSGAPDYYLLTGDRRALEVTREVGDWWANAVKDLFPTPLEKPHYAEAERDFAWPLFTLNEAFRATGDSKYLKAASQIIRHLIAWWQTSADHLAHGKAVGKNDAKQGTGWWTMYPKCDNCPDGFNGTNPWMAGALLSAIIQFRELDRDFQFVDDAIIEDMLFQTMNYVIKYGWREKGRYFVYSEAVDYGGVTNPMLYPLAWLARRYRQGDLPHADWYDTAPQWERIAREAYAVWQDKQAAENTDQGFYGYEIMYPSDYFTLIEQLNRPGS